MCVCLIWIRIQLLFNLLIYLVRGTLHFTIKQHHPNEFNNTPQHTLTSAHTVSLILIFASFCVDLFSTDLDKYQGVILLDCMVRVCLLV